MVRENLRDNDRMARRGVPMHRGDGVFVRPRRRDAAFMIITQEKALVQMTGHPLEKIKKDMSRAVWKSTSESFLGHDLAPSSGEEPPAPRHRAGVASMAWRTNAP